MQLFKPENYSLCRDALIQAGRTPREAIEVRPRRANQAARGKEVEGDHYHTVTNPSRGEQPGERGLQQHGQKNGYRPGRKSQQRKKRGKEAMLWRPRRSLLWYPTALARS
jgi:hypothetical protein